MSGSPNRDNDVFMQHVRWKESARSKQLSQAQYPFRTVIPVLHLVHAS
jgi:hypothetical protein